MPVLEIKKYPNPVLKKKAGQIESVDGELQKLIDDMAETMYAAPGIGLAAPQVGRSIRLIVLDVERQPEKSSLIVLMNPEIVHAEGKVTSEEGCLSVPGYISTIERSGSVLIKGIDREEKPVEIEAEGLLALAFQHEVDHLNGVLFVDRLSPIKKEFFRKRYARRGKSAS